MAGTIATVLGLVGVFIPLLPTTPFLLLAVFFYSRSSRGLHTWLLGNPLFGGYLRRYVERRSMTRRHKTVTLALLWIVIGLSATLIVGMWWERLLLAAVAAGVTGHLLWIKTE